MSHSCSSRIDGTQWMRSWERSCRQGSIMRANQKVSGDLLNFECMHQNRIWIDKMTRRDKVLLWVYFYINCFLYHCRHSHWRQLRTLFRPVYSSRFQQMNGTRTSSVRRERSQRLPLLAHQKYHFLLKHCRLCQLVFQLTSSFAALFWSKQRTSTIAEKYFGLKGRCSL